MKCPQCKNKILKKAMIHGIEIDYCQKCHGIWLNKDELDQICGNM
jgi:Zn-finger nucleic acid-binding protein